MGEVHREVYICRCPVCGREFQAIVQGRSVEFEKALNQHACQIKTNDWVITALGSKEPMLTHIEFREDGFKVPNTFKLTYSDGREGYITPPEGDVSEWAKGKWGELKLGALSANPNRYYYEEINPSGY